DDGTGWSPLDWADHGPHPATVELLVAAGAIRRCPPSRG
ncbi:ankyrin repeat domain-containing protein, partial [Streptomyces sp. NPDC041003]